MFFQQVLLYLVSCIMGRPHPQSPSPLQIVPISVIKDVRSPPGKEGEYSYDIQLSDGTRLKQVGSLGELMKNQNPNPDFEQFLVISGEYSYKDPQGKTHMVSYVADKNGFRPIIDGSTIGGMTSLSTPVPVVEPVNLPPLQTISSSLFSSPSRYF